MSYGLFVYVLSQCLKTDSAEVNLAKCGLMTYLEFVGFLNHHLQLCVLSQTGAAHLRHILGPHRCFVIVGVSCSRGTGL